MIDRERLRKWVTTQLFAVAVDREAIPTVVTRVVDADALMRAIDDGTLEARGCGHDVEEYYK